MDFVRELDLLLSSVNVQKALEEKNVRKLSITANPINAETEHVVPAIQKVLNVIARMDMKEEYAKRQQINVSRTSAAMEQNVEM